MSKEKYILMEDGRRTTGIEQFFESLPEWIIPIQKSIPPYTLYEEGYGYQGVILLDTDKDRVQCHICGRWYKALGKHITVHDINAKEYKDEVGLYQKEPLMSLSTLNKFRSTVHIEQAMENLNKGIGKHNINITRKDRVNGGQTTQFKNRYGTCDAQLRFRLETAIEKYGRVPTTHEERLLGSIFRKRFGSWKEGLNKYGYEPIKQAYNGGLGKFTVTEESEKARKEVELLIAPKCKTCYTPIERRRAESGRLENKLKWLNKKTCSPECYAAYLKFKSSINFNNVRECTMDGCNNPFSARGYCNKHYLVKFRKDRKR
jgi:hypothetical protein